MQHLIGVYNLLGSNIKISSHKLASLSFDQPAQSIQALIKGPISPNTERVENLYVPNTGVFVCTVCFFRLPVWPWGIFVHFESEDP